MRIKILALAVLQLFVFLPIADAQIDARLFQFPDVSQTQITLTAFSESSRMESIKKACRDPTAPDITAVSYPKSKPPSVATIVRAITKPEFDEEFVIGSA